MQKIIKIIKKLNILIFLIMSMFCVSLVFSACAQVRVMTITNADNSIDEVVSVVIDEEKVVQYGYDIEGLKSDISTNSTAQAQTMVDKLNKKINYDMLLASNETKKILTGFYDGVSVVTSDWDGNVFAIGIRFKNIDVYKYYYNISENIKTQTYREEHFFYDKVYYYASTMYVKHNDLYNLVNEYYSANYLELINSETNELLYTYKTDLRRQHSDADYITKQDGEYYHTWVVDKENLDKPIMLYYNVANPENYILVALSITAGVTLILFGVCFILKLTNSKPEKQKDDGN